MCLGDDETHAFVVHPRLLGVRCKGKTQWMIFWLNFFGSSAVFSWN